MTRSVVFFVPVLALALLVQGCGKSHDSLVEEMADRMEAFADILQKCEAEEDVLMKYDELAELAEEIRELKEKARELEAPTAEEERELAETHRKRIRASAARLRKFMQTVGKDPKVDDLIRDVLKGGPS